MIPPPKKKMIIDDHVQDWAYAASWENQWTNPDPIA